MVSNKGFFSSLLCSRHLTQRLRNQLRTRSNAPRALSVSLKAVCQLLVTGTCCGFILPHVCSNCWGMTFSKVSYATERLPGSDEDPAEIFCHFTAAVITCSTYKCQSGEAQVTTRMCVISAWSA